MPMQPIYCLGTNIHKSKGGEWHRTKKRGWKGKRTDTERESRRER